MSKIKAFGAFIYDFVIGDDWLVAAGVAVALIATYALSHAARISAWWLVPVAIVLLLPLSLRRAVRKS